MTEVEGGLASSGPLAGTGYFLALKFANTDSRVKWIKVGLVESQGTGFVKLDEDMDAVFKLHVTDGAVDQKLVVITSDDVQQKVQEFTLSGLTLTT